MPDRRVIAAFSADAYGAVDLTLHHRSDFGSVQAWSGYYVQTRTGCSRTPAVALALDGPLREGCRLGGQLARFPLRAVLFIRREDGDVPPRALMARALRDRGVRVRSPEYAGGHDWGVCGTRAWLCCSSSLPGTPDRLSGNSQLRRRE